MEKIQHGYPCYGQDIGILVFNGISPRVPGDPGHAATFSFPVCYEIVEGCFMGLARMEAKIRDNLIAGAKRLRDRGIRIIAGDCGLMGLYQKELGQLGGLCTSSALCQIPFLWQLIGCQGMIGIITGHSELLTPECLTACGCGGIPVAIRGMESEKHFHEIVIEGGTDLHPEQIEQETVHAAKLLLAEHPQIRAVILECSNLATYSHSVATVTGIPTFDIVSAIRFMEYGIHPPIYNR